MGILHAWNPRAVKCFSSLILRNYIPPVQPPLKLTPVYGYHVSSRCLSWEGFYCFVSLSAPVSAFQNALLDFHNISGLPWWAVISLSTLGIRSFLIFPLAIHQNQVISRIANLNPELEKIAPELTKEVNAAARMFGWDERTAKKIFKRNMKQQYQKLIIKDNCHPFKIVLLAIIQIPIWICFSVSLRNLTFNPSFVSSDPGLLQQQLKTEGALWFPDLTVPESFVIPVLLALVNLTLIEIHALRHIGAVTKFRKAILYLMRFVSLFVAGAAAVNPSSVSFYWLCSSTFGLLQAVLLMSPRFRKIVRIPVTGKESPTPFKDIAANFRKRFS